VVFDALAGRWADTIIVIVSDHDMQPRTALPPVDPMANGADGGWDAYIPDGGSALIHLKPGVDPEQAGAALRRIDGVETWVRANESVLIAGLKPGRMAAAPRYAARGFHGAPITARTVALVGGGDPAVGRIARAIAAHRPHLADWAPTLAPLMGVDLGRVDGRNLLG
jgi:hypothetical protein